MSSSEEAEPEYATVTETAILRGMIDDRDRQIVALTQNLDAVRQTLKGLEQQITQGFDPLHKLLESLGQRITRQSRLIQFHDAALKELRGDLRGIKTSPPQDDP